VRVARENFVTRTSLGPARILRAICLILIFMISFWRGQALAESLQQALASALVNTGSSAVVLDLKTGGVVAAVGNARRAAPGSTLKPLLLEYALRHGIVTPQTKVFCHRNLRVEDRSLPCTHPANEDVFTAETALAESCNTYFAELARRFSSTALETALRETRLPHRPLDSATPEERELAVLGLSGVMVTPEELARAYRDLASSFEAGGPVERGLAGSVSYGMANAAAVPGMTILGKTGTAKNPGESWTHGWFAGVLPGKLVVVVFVPNGDGGTAAHLAQGFFLRLPHGGPAR
jgi:cell division protein FtsI/penicillin-binding protein 2